MRGRGEVERGGRERGSEVACLVLLGLFRSVRGIVTQPCGEGEREREREGRIIQRKFRFTKYFSEIIYRIFENTHPP